MLQKFSQLNSDQQRIVLKSRFDLVPNTEYHGLEDEELTLLKCENLYEAIARAIFGTVFYADLLRRKVLNFLRYSWVNPAIRNLVGRNVNIEN